MNHERYYLLTGAAGFLGTNICMQLLEKGCKVRALVLPNDKSVKFIPNQVEVVLGDLTDAVNYALAQFGYAARTIEEVRCFVGNGARKLIERAVPDGADADAVFEAFRTYYDAHCQE